MIAWMLYSAAVSTVLALAAAAAEPALRATGRPGRWPWAAALAGTLAVPAMARLRALSSDSAESAAMGTGGGTSALLDPLALPIDAIASVPRVGDPSIGLVAAVVWAAASTLLLLSAGLAAWRLRVRRAGWRAERHRGTEILISDDTGPAALTVGRVRIVVPRWALSLEAALFDLLLAHEREHVGARDPEIAAAGLAVAIAFPWNPAVWWQLARLRAAIELDCDARVLARTRGRETYGRLLLEVGRRRMRTAPLAVGIGESATGLERRVRAALHGVPGRSRRRVAGLAAASAALLGLAVCTPDATAPSGPASETATAQPAWDVAPRPTNLAEVNAMGLFRGQAEYARDGDVTVDVLLLVDADGIPELARDAPGSPAAQPGKALAKPIALQLRFEPAYRDGGPVRSVFRLPLTFSATEPMRLGEPVAIDPASPLFADMVERAWEPLRPRIAGSDPGIRAEPGHTPFDEPPALANPDEIRETLARLAHRFRDELADVETAHVWLYINERGEVPQVRTNRSTGNEKMDAVVLGLAASMRFEPARREGEPTPVWVSLPITMTRR